MSSDPKHLLEDAPPWLDISSRHAYQYETTTPEAIAATDGDPQTKALTFLRVSAMRQRRQWEAEHPGRHFPGVFLSPSPD